MATRYEFVIQGQNPRSYTKETQTKIRRQAMRAAAQARKAAGNYGKRNVRQQRLVVQSTDEEAAGAAGAELESGQISPPGTLNSASSSTSTSSSPPSGRSNSDSVEPPSSRSSVGSGDGLSSGEDSPPLTGPDPDELLVPLGSSGARKASSASAWSSSASSQYSQYLVPYDASRQRRHALMPSRMPPSGFDMLVVEYGIHPQDLSGLTSIHIGPIASNVLGQGPTKLLPQVMRCRQWSYFDFVASRYGRGHPCLDDALRCIALKTRAVLVPDQRRYNTEALAQYGRSLRSLQRAIDDPKSWVSADVLCATEILSLFEVSRNDVEKRHACIMLDGGTSLLRPPPPCLSTAHR